MIFLIFEKQYIRGTMGSIWTPAKFWIQNNTPDKTFIPMKEKFISFYSLFLTKSMKTSAKMP